MSVIEPPPIPRATPIRLPRVFSAKALLWRSASALALLLVLWSSALVITQSLPYFTLTNALPFLLEKGTLVFESWWKTFFIAHVAGGIGCLLVGPFIVWNQLILRSRTAHRWVGRGYITFVLLWGAPAGMVLATTAKGGLLGKSGFLLLGILWWHSTYRGLRSIQARRYVEHVGWMVRSYAWATSALSFRAFHLSLYKLGVPDTANYISSIWLSFAVSALIGAWLASKSAVILRHSGPHLRKGARPEHLLETRQLKGVPQ